MSLPRFGVTRPVPVRLMMTAVLVGGIYSAFTIRREFFPQVDPEGARVTLIYPGATPQEIEESMARKVEDALADLEEVDEITTSLSEGGGGIMVEFHSGVDIDEGVEKVKREIDALTDLPDEAEEIRIAEFEPQIPAIMLTLYGEADEEAMKQSIRRMADDLRSLPGMGKIVISGVREYELRVDVSETALLEHGLSLPQVSDAIRAWMEDVPGGPVRGPMGTVNVRTLGVQERAEAVRHIVISATPSGRALHVGDIARVREDFVDDQVFRRFNGHPSVSLTVFKAGDEDAVDMAQMVRAYAAGRRGEPFEPSIIERLTNSSREQAWELGANHPQKLVGQLATHSELARLIEGRLELLSENAIQGAFLIFLTILLALNARTAWWVMSGLVTALCGTLMLMWGFDVTLNLLTMFGLLITLGMLEDDAIVVSENITARYERGDPPLPGAIKGAEQVFWPVIGTVLTTIVAFIPLMFVKGRIGDLLGALPWVVAFSLLVSVLETMIVLPTHMAHSQQNRLKKSPGRIALFFRGLETWRDRKVIGAFIDRYAAFLRLSIAHRYITTATAIAVLIVCVGMVASGRPEFTFLPESDSETIIVDVRLPIGASIAQTEAIARRIELAAQEQPETKSVGTIVGQQFSLDSGLVSGTSSHLAQLFIELTPVETRARESSVVIDSIRAQIGQLEGIERLSFAEMSGGPGGPDITLQVSGDDDQRVNEIAETLKAKLGEFDGVYDIADDNYDSQRELQIQLKPAAAGLGLSVSSVARQVRGAFYGLEPHVFSAKREDIDVRVRLDENSRRTLATVENMWVVTPQGQRVPLQEVAELISGEGYESIHRIDRQRVVSVTASTSTTTNPEMITEALRGDVERLRQENRGVGIKFAGRQEDLNDAIGTLPLAFAAALLMIYVILAWLFSSYSQPLVVMLAIPFAVIGVVWGHLLLGYQLTFLSLIGFVALTGVVVNNSLILIEFYNARRREGMGLREALIVSGRDRIRPIVLTSITTFFGLMPLVFETSFQAKFLIPMAIAISFGLLSSTVLTLAVLPCLIVILDDIKEVFHFLWYGLPRAAPPRPPEGLPLAASIAEGE
ncbi:MAG: efflux RND transporter permease subunit [Phycisphaerales bacterium]|nr:efflux RND transporter permease subunit [Phycisphaerales bacterium]MCI0629469.1 efflux RND transporter permease subunit [Phycisphaerales bacterium]MCI0674761.1 efflux RND transporter permease subunit [Phycisphaerales bacterium]